MDSFFICAYNQYYAFRDETYMQKQEVTTGLQIISGVYWDQGGRDVNQDSLILQQVMTNRGRVVLAAVSDGIGGLREGENASGYITEKLIGNFYNQMISLVGRGKGKKSMERSLMRCFYDINDGLRRYGNGKDIKLGATISLLFLWKRSYVIFHLGDSRIYLCCRRKAKLLTEDHTDGGRGLTRCMGSFPFQCPDIRFGRIHREEGFLLCTDGFYTFMEKDIAQVLWPREIGSGEQIEKRLRELALAAQRRGQQDNMSAVYLIASGRKIHE